MSWRDRLREASFRGVPFGVDSHDHSFGRRADVHDYPLKPDPWVEDLGRETRRYSLTAYIVGPDYDQARDALIAALETEGPGTLIHPWLGVRTVACLTSSLREDLVRGGEAGFQLEFVETGPNTAPEIGEDPSAAAVEAAGDARTQAAEGFAEQVRTGGLPGFVLDEAGALIDRATEAYEDLAGRLTGRGAALSGFLRQATALRGRVLDLASRPAGLASSIIDGLRQAARLADTPRAALAALMPLLAFGSTFAAVLGLTPARRAQRDNQDLVLRLVRQAAAAEAVQIVTAIDFTAYDEAVAIRDQLADAIDAIGTAAADAGDDAAWRSMETLRQAMIRDVTARGGSLERLFAWTPPTTTPLLVIAHDLYGDAGRAAELGERNAVRHPGFVPGGTALQALSLTGAARG